MPEEEWDRIFAVNLKGCFLIMKHVIPVMEKQGRGSWGAQIIDDLMPQDGEHLVVKKGFGGFSNTPLDTILRNMGVTTCVACGVTTCVCVSTTIRGGVEYNYRMIVVGDAVADVDRSTHEAELRTMARIFADVKTTDEVVGMLDSIGS